MDGMIEEMKELTSNGASRRNQHQSSIKFIEFDLMNWFVDWRLNELSESKRKTKSFDFDWMRANGISVAFSSLGLLLARLWAGGPANAPQREDKREEKKATPTHNEWSECSGMKGWNVMELMKSMKWNFFRNETKWMEWRTKQPRCAASSSTTPAKQKKMKFALRRLVEWGRAALLI